MSKGENMVERLASVIKGLGECPFCDFEGTEAARRIARAVIEAMMEPTPEMIHAVRQSIFDMTQPNPHVTSTSTAEALIWSALRAALSQPNDETGDQPTT